MRKAVAIVAGAALLAGACSSGDDPEASRATSGVGDLHSNLPVGTWPQASFASALAPYDDCDALLTDLQDRALERVGPYGLDGGYGPVDDLVMLEGDVAAAPSADGGEAAASRAPTTTVVDPTGSSQTNVQEAGVDEPDSVKHDGSNLYSVVDGQLRVADVSGDAPTLRSTTDLPLAGGDLQLLLDGDRLLVIGSGYGAVVPYADDLDGRAASSIAPTDAPTTELAVLDVSDPTRPAVVDQLSVDGSLLGARMVDGRARLVTSAAPSGFDFVYPQSSRGEDVAEEANRRIITETTVEDWLPTSRRVVDGEVTEVEPLVACDAVARPGVPSGTSTVSLLTVDVADGTIDPADTVSVVADGQTVYASTDRLYVATTSELPPDVADDPQQADGDEVVTGVHAFDITGDGPAAYLATGEVPGHLLDQFAMSEHDGVLRVATTVEDWSVRGQSESFVTTLGQDGADLVELGQVGDMGRGEEIYSVRFVDDQGYVVTFRQTDPLYTLDLADPAAPAVVGELKIPGFSTYLHPIGDGRLLGIGQEATDQGRTTGTKVSLFDVNDPANPTEVTTWTVPGANSMAEGDHHAFLWWAPEDLLVVPLSSYGYDPLTGAPTADTFEGAVGLTVAGDTITERGRIEHLLTGGEPFEPECGPNERCVEPPIACTPEGSCTSGPATTVVSECGPEQDCAVIGPVPSEPGCDPAACDPGPVPPYQPSGTPIARSLVVGGKLLTVSSLGVERSAMGDLAELSWLPWS